MYIRSTGCQWAHLPKNLPPHDRCERTGQPFVGGRRLGEQWTRGYGTCVKTEKDGDTMLVTWEADKPWQIIAGSGKYAGITGSGTSKTEMITEGPNAWTGVYHHTVKWQIKRNPA